jgi:hypothetical protein
LVEFLTINQGNQLLKSVLFDLKQDFFIAEIRAFGIISKLYMAPLWNCLEDKSIDLSQMNGIYRAMLESFEAAAEDPAILMGGVSPFQEDFLNRDLWWEKVFCPDPRYDGLTVTALGVILPALSLFTKRHFADHLEGGKVNSMIRGALNG